MRGCVCFCVYVSSFPLALSSLGLVLLFLILDACFLMKRKGHTVGDGYGGNPLPQVTHRQVRVKQQCPKQKLAESRGLPNVWPEESAMSTGLEGEVSRKGSGLRAWQTLAYSFPSPSPSLLDPWVLHTYLFFRCRAPRPGARAAFPCIGDLQELTSRKLLLCSRVFWDEL